MADSINVVHLSAGGGGGASIAALRQHESLRAAGVHSRLLTAVPTLEPERDDGAISPEPPFRLVERVRRRLPFAWDAETKLQARIAALSQNAGRPEFFEAFSSPYARCTPEAHPWVREADVVHLHWVSGFVDYRRFFSSVHQPLVWTLHDQHPYLGGFHYEADRANAPSLCSLDDECRRFKQSALARSSQSIAVVGNSRWNTAAARASGFFPAKTRFETIYYPLDTVRFSPRDKTAAKLALGIDPRRSVIGFACTNLANRRKGLEDLLAALARIAATQPNSISLLSFGLTPDERTRTQLQLSWLPLGFLQKDDLKVLAYSAMDVFVIPSRDEAFGQTAIEALACGTSVIGSNTGGIPEALPESLRSFLFFPGDRARLSHNLLAMLADNALRQRLASEGRRHVERQHSPSASAKAWCEVYNQLLDFSHVH